MTDLQAILDKGGPWERAKLIGGQLLIQGDCREVMGVLPRVDACLTDPPFGIKRDKGIGGGGYSIGGRPRPNVRKYKSGWDSERAESEAIADMCALADHAIIWGGQFFADLLPPQGKWLFWDKCQLMPSYGDGELAWTNLSGDAVKQFTYAGSGYHAKERARVHPTQKPIALMEWCLGFLPNAQTILDPFAGSFTTAVACQRLGRQSISIELDPDYYQIGLKRVQEVVNNPPLFKPDIPKPKQEAMEL